MGYWRGVDDRPRGADVNAPSKPSGPIGSAHRQRPLLAALGVLLVVVSAITIVTLRQLDHVYSWDQLTYHEKAVRLSHDLRSSFFSTAWGVARSIHHDEYNDLAAVPLAAWVSVVGEHRQSFVLGVLVLYAVPTSALFVVLMSTAHRRFSGWSPTSWLAVGWLLTPWLIGAFWTPTILGRVGVGGLGLLFAAVTLHLRRPLKAQRWWEPVCAGCLLAAAVLFQRWYVFAVTGILVAIGIQTLVVLVRQERSAERLGIVGRVLLLPLSLAVLLMPFTMGVVSRVLHTAYLDVFAGFHHSGSVMYLWGNPWSLAQRLGSPSLLVVLAAFTFGMLCRQLRGFLAAATLAGVVSLALFSRVQAPGVHHTLIWVGVECIILGIGLVQVSTWPRTTSRMAILASIVMLSTSVTAVLFLSRGNAAGSGLPWWNSMAPSLTVGDFLPRNRDVVLATVEFLETNVPSGSSIVLLSSSLSVNDDVLRNIRFSLPDCDVDTRYRILPARQISRDRGLPYFMLRADYVLVVDPLAFRSPPRDKVTRIDAGWLFRRASPLLACFRTVAGPTALPDGCTITAFKLQRGMNKKAREILADELEAVFGERRAPDLRP